MNIEDDKEVTYAMENGMTFTMTRANWARMNRFFHMGPHVKPSYRVVMLNLGDESKFDKGDVPKKDGDMRKL